MYLVWVFAAGLLASLVAPMLFRFIKAYLPNKGNVALVILICALVFGALFFVLYYLA